MIILPMPLSRGIGEVSIAHRQLSQTRADSMHPPPAASCLFALYFVCLRGPRPGSCSPALSNSRPRLPACVRMGTPVWQLMAPQRPVCIYAPLGRN